MGSRKALKEVSVAVNNSNETDSYNNIRQLRCDSRKRNEVRVCSVLVKNSAQIETDIRNRLVRRRKTTSENDEKDVSSRLDFKEPSMIPRRRTTRSKVLPNDAVTSTPVSVSKSIVRNVERVPEFHLSPIIDKNRVLSTVSTSFDNVARTKSRVLSKEFMDEDEKRTSDVNRTDEESKKENEVTFCSPPSKSYSRSPKSNKITPKAKWSDDDSDTTLEDDEEDNEECGFLSVANSKPTLPCLFDTNVFDTANDNLLFQKQKKKLNDTKKKIKKKKKDPDAHLYEEMMKEFEEVDKTELCFV